MISLAAVTAALLAASGPAAEPPTRQAPGAPAPPARPSDGPAQAQATFAAPPPAPPARAALGAPEWSVHAGWLDTRLMGVTFPGLHLRAAGGLAAPGQRALLQLVLDVFAGETRPGLAVRGGSLGSELWLEPAGRVRAGLGSGLAAVAYRRFTAPGEWPTLVTVGLRAGVEVDLLRLSAGTIVLGAHGSAYLGPWVSGSLSAGFRGGGAGHAAR